MCNPLESKSLKCSRQAFFNYSLINELCAMHKICFKNENFSFSFLTLVYVSTAVPLIMNLYMFFVRLLCKNKLLCLTPQSITVNNFVIVYLTVNFEEENLNGLLCMYEP